MDWDIHTTILDTDRNDIWTVSGVDGYSDQSMATHVLVVSVWCIDDAYSLFLLSDFLFLIQAKKDKICDIICKVYRKIMEALGSKSLDKHSLLVYIPRSNGHTSLIYTETNPIPLSHTLIRSLPSISFLNVILFVARLLATIFP